MEPHALPWSLCELKLGEDDWEWLQNWARHLEFDEAKSWTSGHQEHTVRIAGKTLSSITAFGLLLIVFCAEAMRREGSEDELWPTIQRDKNRNNRFEESHGVFWNDVGAPRGCVYRAIERAAYHWNLRHCFPGDERQAYMGTIRLQYGFTLTGSKRLPHWLCGYYWPTPVRDLVRGNSTSSASFGRFWNDLHELRDGQISPSDWKIKHIASPWILPLWAEEICDNARAQSGLRKISNTRTDAQNSRISQAMATIWDAQAPLSLAQFLGETTLKLEGLEPVFRVALLDFVAPENAPYLENGALALYIEDECVGQWIRQGKSRRFKPSHAQCELPLIEPTLTARLVTGVSQVVAKQALALWDAQDGFGWWNLQTGRRYDVWKTVPRAQTSYALLVDDDLQIEPLPTQYSRMGKRVFLRPEFDWFENARILEDGVPFWKTPQKEEPEWARDFDLSVVSLPAGLRLGQSWQMKIRCPARVRVRALRWGGRWLQSEGENLFVAPPFSLQTLAATVTIEADLNGPNDEQTTVERRVNVPLCVVLWRLTRRNSMDFADEWKIADGSEIWNTGQEREWKIWGQWNENAQVCQGDLPFASVPRRPRALRPAQPSGAPLSVREAPFASENTRIEIARSVRDGGILLDVKRRARSEIHLTLSTAVEPTQAHKVVVWGHRGALAMGLGEQIVPMDAGKRWIVPFSFQHESAPVLGAGIAFAGTWLGAHFTEDWRELCPKNWESERAYRFALMARWMRLPWHEQKSLYFALAHHWPIEVLRAWLGKTANNWDLRFSNDGGELVRAVFRGNWNGDNATAKALFAVWGEKTGAAPPQLLRELGEADPFLMLAIARDWANGQSGFARLFRSALEAIKSASPVSRSPEISQLKSRLKARLEGATSSDSDSHALRFALESSTNRQFAATYLLERLAAQLQSSR